MNSTVCLPWIEKYRPKLLNDIVSHKLIIQSLRKFIDQRTLPHMLFFGPPGSGKTSTIMCCANEIYGEYIDHMTLLLNASNERGIETVRTKIKNFVSNKNSVFFPQATKAKTNIFKLVILDEIDSMTVEAQGMLRQSIEKNSETTRFCLICNNIDKINPALQSRCALFHFTPLRGNDMLKRLKIICTTEHITATEEILQSIISLSEGDMRTPINMLQSLKKINSATISIDDVYKISGYCMPKIINKIFKILMNVFNTKIRLSNAIQQIIEIIVENNITIFNLLDNLKNSVIDNTNLSDVHKLFLIDNFAKIEIYDSVNIDQNINIINITSLFILASQF